VVSTLEPEKGVSVDVAAVRTVSDEAPRVKCENLVSSLCFLKCNVYRYSAAAAQRSRRFDSQIVPVHTTWKDPKTGEVKNVVIDKDDGIREGVSVVGRCTLNQVDP
jgi:hypothetical protein